jgi:transcriptional regulator with XRE-family HTH domain
MAKLLGVSFQQLQKLETPGKSNLTVKTLAAISAALNETLEIKLAA